MTSLEDVASVVLGNTSLDYFDMKSLRGSNKALSRIMNGGVCEVNQSIAHRLYANLYGHLANVLPGRAKDPSRVSGVKVVFRGDGRYKYFREFHGNMQTLTAVDPYMQELFVMGMACKDGENTRYYFGTSEDFSCVKSTDLSQCRDKIYGMIGGCVNRTRQFDVVSSNMDDVFYEFLTQFMNIVAAHLPLYSINLALENSIHENDLIFH